MQKFKQRGFQFGAFQTNSDLFFGGLPPDLRSEDLSYPLVLQTRNFAGSIRNIVYRVFPVGVTTPAALDQAAVRAVEDDYCGGIGDYCKNGGYCYSTDYGPKCECQFTDYMGKYCEISKLHAFNFYFKIHSILMRHDF